MTLLSMSSHSSVELERPPGIWKVMGLIPVRDSDFFSPILVSCRSVHFSHFITELQIHHLYSFMTGRFILKQVDYSLLISMHDRNLELIM